MLYSVIETAAEVARFYKEMFLEKYFVKKSAVLIRTLDLWIINSQPYPFLHNDLSLKVDIIIISLITVMNRMGSVMHHRIITTGPVWEVEACALLDL